MEFNHYLQAKTKEEAFEAIKNGATIIGGGAWVKLLKKSNDTVVGLELLDLEGITQSESTISIGAMTTLGEIEQSHIIRSLGSGILASACHHIMGVGLRNIATIGGSVAGKFGFSDLLPALLVLDAQVNLYHGGQIPIDTYLSGKYQKDLLVSIDLPNKPSKGYIKSFKKTSTDFPLLVVAINYGEKVRISIGSRPGIAQLAGDAMAYINGESEITKEVIQQTAKLVGQTMIFGTNVRSSADYREDLAVTTIRRGLEEVINGSKA